MIKLLLILCTLSTILLLIWIVKRLVKEYKHKKIRQRAEKWFSDRGIDVRVDPKTLKEPNPIFAELPSEPIPAFGPNSGKEVPEFERMYECRLTITPLFFYTWFGVEFYDFRNMKRYQFEGGSGGIGLVGGLEAWGVIYYADQKKLLAANIFGLAYGSLYGGLAQATWGLTGNASAEMIGTGAGVVGGSGEWKEIVK